MTSFSAQLAGSAFWAAHQDRALELLNGGLAYRDVAAVIGCSRNALIGRMWRNEVKGLGFHKQDHLGPPTETINDRLDKLARLAPTGCAYPIGEPHEADFHYCNQPRHKLSPYCAAHLAIVWRKHAEPAE